MSGPLVVLCAMDWDNRWKRLIEEHLIALGLGGDVLAEIMPDPSGLVTERGARALDTARLAILVVSPEFLHSRHMMRSVLQKLVLRANTVARRGPVAEVEFLPIVVHDCQWGQLPNVVQVAHDLQVPLERRETREVHRILALIARRAYQHLETIQALPAPLVWTAPPEAAVALGPLASDSLVAELQDREALAHRLNLAWMDPQTRLVNLTGEPGVGKTTLLAHWLRLMGRDKYRGAERVFAWSFQHQGDDQDVSEFLFRAGEFFDLYDDPALSHWEVGARLGRRISELRAILVLDGLDAVLRPGEGENLVIRDEALLMLIRRLTTANRGLCVLASRQPITDLATGKNRSVAAVSVEPFPVAEAAELLAKLRISGEASAIRDAAECALGHPQSLRALGAWLTACRRNTGRMGDFSQLFSVPAKQRRTAVLEHFLQSLGDGPELQLLRVLAAMDRAAQPAELAALLAGEPIAGLTNRLAVTSESSRRNVAARLRVAGLLQIHAGDALELHPLVREHLRRRLPTEREAAWLTLQGRLLAMYRPAADEPRDDPASVNKAVRAAYHGSMAGEYAMVLGELIEGRLWGAGDPLRLGSVRQRVVRSGVLATLIDEDSQLPREALSPDEWLLVARRWRRGLRAIGCFAEATIATERQLEQASIAGHSDATGECLIELCDLLLWQGRIKDATRRVNELLAIPGIKERRQQFRDAVNLSARVLHLKGNFSDALERYRVVEKQSEKQSPAESLLYSAPWWHCDAILDSGDFPLAERIAWREWERLADQKGLAAAGLLLVLTRLNLALWRHSRDWRYREEALKHLKQAEHLSVRSGMTEMILAAQLAEAGHRRTEGKLAAASELLADIAVLVTRMGLRLLAIEVQLEWARLRLEQGRPQEVHERLDLIRQQIVDHAYGRAGGDLTQIQQRFVVAPAQAGNGSKPPTPNPPHVDTSGTNRQAVK